MAYIYVHQQERGGGKIQCFRGALGNSFPHRVSYTIMQITLYDFHFITSPPWEEWWIFWLWILLYKANNLLVLTSLASLANFKCFDNSESSFVSLHLRSPDVLSPIKFQCTYKVILTWKIKVWSAKSIKDKWGSQNF